MFSFFGKHNSIQTYNKKVRTMLITCTLTILTIASIALIMVSIFMSKSNGKYSLQSDVSSKALTITTWGYNYDSQVESIIRTLETSDISDSNTLRNILNEFSKQKGLEKASGIYAAYGNAVVESTTKPYVGSNDFKKAEWYTNAMKNNGSVIVNTPFLRNDTEYATFSCMTTVNDEICVVAIDVDLSEIVDIINNSVDGKSYLFVTDANGNILVHPKRELTVLEDHDNTLTTVAKGAYSAIYDSLQNANTNFVDIKDYDKANKLSYYTSDWKSGITVIGVVPKYSIYTVVYFVLAFVIVCFVLDLILLNTVLSDKISKWFLPLLSISNKVDCLADGDLSVKFDENIVSSELDILVNALNKTIVNLNLYINDIKDVLKNLSDGQLNVETSDCYEGDFNDIKESLDSIISNLNSVFIEINDTARGVSYNAEHMQASSQELASGVTEQSEYIKDMFNSIDKLSVLIKSTATNSVQASEMAYKSTTLLEAENEDMIELLKSMAEIKETSKQIGAIINTINEIADQTDLLALNASIEASRAGEAGKSFAVIAGEVGSLARDSAEAVNTITELINNSTKAVTKGVDIANKTAEHLAEAVTYSNESKTMIDEISTVANKQSLEITKINSHVSQISGVTENNQAAAQENFAISDEASNQAQLLKSMVDKFDFKTI